MEDLVNSIPHFGGTAHEDVVRWLNIINEISDRAKLRPSNRYIVAQCSLTKAAACWFRYNRYAVSDWSTFQVEIIKTFQPTSSFRLLSPLSTTSQLSSQELPGHACSHEPDAVPVVESAIDPAFESEIKPDADIKPDAVPDPDPISARHRTPDDKPDDPNVNPDSTLDVNGDPHSAVDPDDTLTLNGASPQPVVDSIIRVITESPRLPSISPVHIQYRRCYELVPQKSSSSQAFLSGRHGDSRGVLFAGPVSFNTVHHQWRYKCNRMDGSRRIFQHERFKLWPRLRKWKYRQRTIVFLRSEGSVLSSFFLCLCDTLSCPA